MKYIIELGEETNMVQVINVTQNGNAYVDAEYDVTELEELTADYINEYFGDLQDTAYQKGFDDAHRISEEEYQRGFKDGKAVNDKGCEGCKYAGSLQGSSPCYNCSNYYQNNWTAKDDKIEVGDEVIHKEYKNRFVVTKMQNGYIYGISKDGSWNNFRNDGSFVKTGRHFDIDKILEAMKHD